jgi:hypothetical protein
MTPHDTGMVTVPAAIAAGLMDEVRAFRAGLEARLLESVHRSLERAVDDLRRQIGSDSLPRKGWLADRIPCPGSTTIPSATAERSSVACRSLRVRDLLALLVAAGWTPIRGSGPHPLKVGHRSCPGRLIPIPVHSRSLSKEQLGLLRGQIRRLGLEAPF